MPADVSIASAAAEPPYIEESAERSILRRCAKAKSMMANVRRRSASSPGVSRRVNATSLDSTLGTGQKIWRETTPSPLTSAYHAAFTLGTPYSFVEGTAARRSATSACTITTPLRRLGKISSIRRNTGTETL